MLGAHTRQRLLPTPRLTTLHGRDNYEHPHSRPYVPPGVPLATLLLPSRRFFFLLFFPVVVVLLPPTTLAPLATFLLPPPPAVIHLVPRLLHRQPLGHGHGRPPLGEHQRGAEGALIKRDQLPLVLIGRRQRQLHQRPRRAAGAERDIRDGDV